jgi:hypothetical protein
MKCTPWIREFNDTRAHRAAARSVISLSSMFPEHESPDNDAPLLGDPGNGSTWQLGYATTSAQIEAARERIAASRWHRLERSSPFRRAD